MQACGRIGRGASINKYTHSTTPLVPVLAAMRLAVIAPYNS